MKRIICFALAVIMCLALVACGEEKKPNEGTNNSTGEYVPSGNASDSRDYFEWSATDDTMIVGYTAEGLKQTELAIPVDCTSVQGLKENENVKYIEFKGSDTKILSNTFRNCSALESVKLPSNLTEIDDSVFNGCANLKTIEIPEQVDSIGSNAFMGCTSLSSIQFNGNIENIGRQAFSKCSALKSVSIPDSVSTIGKSAFEECTALSDLKFGSGLKTVEESAFQKCTSLIKVVLPEGVTSLEIWAFAYCDAIEEIHLPASLENIAVSSIVQTHKFKVFVVEGSYADQSISGLMGVEFYDKQYQ